MYTFFFFFFFEALADATRARKTGMDSFVRLNVRNTCGESIISVSYLRKP